MKGATTLLKSGFNSFRGACGDVVRIARNPRQELKSLYGVSLYRNAGYLLAGTAVTSIGGFVFWIIAARFFPVEAVGLGSAIIAALGIVALFSELGLGIGLIRFLPGAGRNGNDMLNTCLTVSGSASIAIALIFLAGLGLWSPELLPVRQQPVFFASFIIFAIMMALEPLVLNTFLARRSARFILIKRIIHSSLRVALVGFFAVIVNNAFGIVTAYSLAVAIALVIAVIWFVPRVQSGYRPFPRIQKGLLNELRHYAAGNYVARLLLQMTPVVLPLVVLNILGAEMNAYFYIAWTVATALKVIPSSIFDSLFAEGSNDEASVRANTAKSLKLTFLLLLPLTALILMIARPVLLLFGEAYAENAALLLRVVTLSVVPWGINYLYVSVERIRKNTGGIITVTAVVTFLSLALSYLLMPRMGLVGVGIGYAAGQTIVATAVVIYLWRRYYRAKVQDKTG